MDMKLFHEISNYKCHQFKTNILIYSHTTEKTIRFVWGEGVGWGGGAASDIRAAAIKISTSLFYKFVQSNTAQKMKFSTKDFFSKCDQIRRKSAGLVTFTEEILMKKFIFVQCNEKKSQLPSSINILVFKEISVRVLLRYYLLKWKNQHRSYFLV